MSKIFLHACGGAGVTIASKEINRLVDDPNLDIEVRYIDTTRADIDNLPNIKEDKVFLVTNSKVNKRIDGSGGVREALDPYITESMEKYVDKLEYEKDDIHIVLSSASGGSGSLIAPRLIHNLKNMGVPAIYITLVDTSSIEYCNTSIKTLTHIDLMGRKYNYSIPTLIINNKEAIKIVNSRIGIRSELLAILLSASHKALDTADTVLFASNGYDKEVTGLVSIGIYKDNTIVNLKDNFISTLRVLTNDEYFKVDTDLLTKIKQYKIGYLSEELVLRLEELKYPIPLYFAITRNNAIASIQEAKAELEEKLKINEDKIQVFDIDTDLGIKI
jgi:hypothetical protein